ncbi:hypothetical protein Cmaq_0213 [Caldivirga maquilingensis IC-167]|uniref:Uncharacterized protein n=2 Tax=Caldivirga maquilingensis TaxID=76887 RepID=A8MAM6_CALMQ|nr:hypothetical protein Cmaq_0213 [Caldivirga maquilingensis IC-167]
MEGDNHLYYPLPKNRSIRINGMEAITLIYDESTMNLVKELLGKGITNVKLIKAYGDELPTPILITGNIVLTGLQAIQYIRDIGVIRRS